MRGAQGKPAPERHDAPAALQAPDDDESAEQRAEQAEERQEERGADAGGERPGEAKGDQPERREGMPADGLSHGVL